MTTERTEQQAPAADTKALEKALDAMLVEAREALDELVECAENSGDYADDPDETLSDLKHTVRTAVDMLDTLQRLVRGRTMREIHGAFGAPGHWGYETALGKALAKTYGTPGGEDERPEPEVLTRECVTCGYAPCMCDQQ